ncbi:hypothetical protein HO173_004979 [Letharia columbiana]|uniref:Mitochondrial import inner membrane translocase subunit TIM54 n=1 Tax=Letharia columbiana TaxID=112416 RepID=A0A8H6FXP8_9LECA|nr:uncharacterized protein HO173_004979 [Letharia columbiana]KAF6236688.1 hypothetical protein HO173_004979 [Letharia columbiana]
MTEKPPSKDASPAASSKAAGNPALRMMGLPNFKFKLPSRNWLIFGTITGSFTSTLLYDRYHKRKAQRKWCTLVSHLAQEPLPVNMMPRRITIFLTAPPGDGLRVSRDHFHEYIKPILVAGAMDWDVVEGRREGEVRAGLAEKIRKLRKRNGETSQAESSEESQEDLYQEMRKMAGIKDWDGVQGDLVLGRHTWKEYIRGLHEGWLGPLDEVQPPEPETTDLQPLAPHSPDSPLPEMPASGTPSSSPPQTDPPTPELPSEKPTGKPENTTHHASLHYAFRICVFASGSHAPYFPLPITAPLVLASHSRPFTQSTDFASATDPDDDASPSMNDQTESAVTQIKEVWEQEVVLREEESEWHKSAWKSNEEGDMRERVWQERMVVDGRIGSRMKCFELRNGQEEEAAKLDAAKRQEDEGYVERAKKWAGLGSKEKPGWETGLEGDESA